MSRVFVIARVEARQGKAATTMRALTKLIRPTHEEEGCEIYALHRSIDDPNVFFFVERWTSRKLLDAHLANDHLVAFLRVVDDLLISPPDITVLEPLPAGDHTKGVLA